MVIKRINRYEVAHAKNLLVNNYTYVNSSGDYMVHFNGQEAYIDGIDKDIIQYYREEPIEVILFYGYTYEEEDTGD